MLLEDHNALFKDDLGTIHPFKATLHVKQDAHPKFYKPRPMPFALKDVVGQELDRLDYLFFITCLQIDNILLCQLAA